MWTIVSLAPRQRYARPIANAPLGTWHEAYEAARPIQEIAGPDVSIWIVSAQGVPVVPEDVDNILVSRGREYRRVPIRWDAAPQYTYVEVDDDDECEGHESLSGALMGESYYCDGSCRRGARHRAARGYAPASDVLRLPALDAAVRRAGA